MVWPDGAGKYTLAQRHRFYRDGVRRFFRLDSASGPPLQTMGDCGAFTYIREEVPPYTPDQVIDFYDQGGFDLGISIDHVIFGYNPSAGDDPRHGQVEMWRARQQLTLDLAASVPGQMQGQEGALRAPRCCAGLEPRVLRRSRPGTSDRLATPGSPSAAWSPSRPTRSSPACEQIDDGPRVADPTAPARYHPLQQHLHVRVTRGHQLRQHLGVPPGVQRRQGQLPHSGTHLHCAPRAPG